MPTSVQVDSPGGKWTYDFEFEIDTGAVVENADGTTSSNPEVTVTRTGVGVYRADIVGNFQKLLARHCRLQDSVGNFDHDVQVTAYSLGGGTPTATGESVTTVTFTVVDELGAAADIDSGFVSAQIVFQKNKI